MPRAKYRAQCYHLNIWRMTSPGDCYQRIAIEHEAMPDADPAYAPVDDLLITPSIPLGSCEIGEYSRLDLLPGIPTDPKHRDKNRELDIPLDGVYHLFYRSWDHLLIVPAPDPDVFDSPHWEDDLVRGGEGTSPRADVREWQKHKKQMKEWFGNGR